MHEPGVAEPRLRKHAALRYDAVVDADARVARADGRGDDRPQGVRLLPAVQDVHHYGRRIAAEAVGGDVGPLRAGDHDRDPLGETSNASMPGSSSKTDSAASWCSPCHGRTFWLTPLTKNPP